MVRVLLKFLRSAEGVSLTFFVVAMPAFIGLSLLAIDIGRGNNLHYDLQKAVDALAIAGAKELDGGPFAIQRADAAIDNIVRNGSRFSDGGGTSRFDLSNVQVTYLCGLPADDDEEINAQDASDAGFTVDCPPDEDWDDVGYGTDDPRIAAFVWVQISGANAESYTTLFPVNLISNDTVQMGAQAVAGGPLTVNGDVCGIAPIWICNPFEDMPFSTTELSSLAQMTDRYTDSTETVKNPWYGRSMAFRPQPNTGTMIPGNFGYLRTSEGNGASALGRALAYPDNGECFNKGSAPTEPGFKASVEKGWNTRFGKYDGFGLNASNAPPAPNTRDGRNAQNRNLWDNGNALEPAPDDSGFHFKHWDDAVASDITLADDIQFTVGNGEWGFQDYLAVNHPLRTNSDFPSEWFDQVDPDTGSPIPDTAMTPSRFDMYMHEIENNMVTDESLGPDLSAATTGDGETGIPEGFTPAQVENNSWDRRLVKAAVVNCRRHEGQGQTNVKVIGVVSLFMLHAVNQNEAIHMELYDVSGFDGNGSLDDNLILADTVLYR